MNFLFLDKVFMLVSMEFKFIIYYIYLVGDWVVGCGNKEYFIYSQCYLLIVVFLYFLVYCIYFLKWEIFLNQVVFYYDYYGLQWSVM